MKKIICTALALGILVGTVAGCKQSDGVIDVSAELSRFHETEMTSVYAAFDEVKAEIALWDSFTDPAQLTDSLNTNVLPDIAEALRLIDTIVPKTGDVEELKGLYKSAMEKYKQGYASLLAAFDAGSEDDVYAAYAVLEEGKTLVESYEERLNTFMQKYQTNTAEGETT